MATGIDVSYAQGKPDWAKVKASGKVDFVYAKASGGLKGPDVSFVHNWAGLKANGIPRGAYHFYLADPDPVAQAEVFYKIVGPLDDGDLPPMIDVEVERPKAMTPKQFAKNVRSFMERAEELFQRRLVVYTGGPIFSQETNGADAEDVDYISDRDLWLAAYVVKPDAYVPAAWKKKGKSWVIWQKSGDKDAYGKPGARFPGINNVVDLDVTQGAADDLPAWIEASKIKKAEPPPVTPPEPAPSPDPNPLPIPLDPPAPPSPPEPQPSPDPSKPPLPPAPIVPSDPTGLLGILFAIIRFIFSIFTGRKRS